MFSLPFTVTVSGREVPVRTDFRVILEIFVMLADVALSDADKTEALLRMFYEERPADIPAALQAFRDFADPGSPARKPSGPALVNWSHDFPLLVGPVNHVLGAECRSMPHLHWHTFLAAYMEISPDSVFSQTLQQSILLSISSSPSESMLRLSRAYLVISRSIAPVPFTCA